MCPLVSDAEREASPPGAERRTAGEGLGGSELRSWRQVYVRGAILWEFVAKKCPFYGLLSP